MAHLTSRPLAALSSTLLARKGEARPAMRRQGSVEVGADDLGWNDMGMDRHDAIDEQQADSAAEAPPVPPVLIQREALHEEFAAPVIASESAKTAADGAPVLGIRRSAFTLRLDAERRLRLRLASAAQRRSAQQLVTEALDVFLAKLPEVEELARQLPPQATDHPMREIR